MKLGKKAARIDPRTLRLSSYTAALPDPPPARDWLAKFSENFDFGMMLNDNLGDCTCASLGHFIQVWTSETWSHPITVPDSTVLMMYEKACGYNPKDSNSDQGGVELDVLNWWRKNPIKVKGNHQLAAYADATPSNHKSVMQAIDIFGGVYIGLQLPLSAQDQVNAGEIWQPGAGERGKPGSWGGHAVGVHQYDADGLTCITWGKRQRMSWEFWDDYVDEAHALVSPDWTQTNWQTISGLNWAQLLADVSQLA